MPARAHTDSPPARMSRMTDVGIALMGMPTSARAKSGVPPIA
jgi:hypothetical protein